MKRHEVNFDIPATRNVVFAKSKDDPRVMVYAQNVGMKKKEFSNIRGLSQSPKVYLNLKGS